jgi:bifunctional non-homologous end joining protein LigD
VKTSFRFGFDPYWPRLSLPFDESGWIYEEKYDGIRILAYKEGSKVTLLSRNDNDRTEGFPSIVATIRALPASTLLLDGEVIALDRDKISRFQMLQRGGRARYAVFDCLFLNGHDFRRETLTTRRTALEKEISDSRELIFSRRLAANGFEAFRIAEKRGFEGLVAKRVAYSDGNRSQRKIRGGATEKACNLDCYTFGMYGVTATRCRSMCGSSLRKFLTRNLFA